MVGQPTHRDRAVALDARVARDVGVEGDPGGRAGFRGSPASGCRSSFEVGQGHAGDGLVTQGDLGLGLGVGPQAQGRQQPGGVGQGVDAVEPPAAPAAPPARLGLGLLGVIRLAPRLFGLPGLCFGPFGPVQLRAVAFRSSRSQNTASEAPTAAVKSKIATEVVRTATIGLRRHQRQAHSGPEMGRARIASPRR